MEPKTRIISGKWKGRVLTLPVGPGVRPTRNRVLQAVFNLLESRVDMSGLMVADLCCGSGAWGLEAASRGAGGVVMVDTHAAAARANWKALGAVPDVLVLDVDAAVWAPAEPLDVVLADPPYHSGLAEALLARRALLGRPGTWWCLEVAADETLPLDGFDDVVERRYGVSKVWVGKQVS